MELNLAGRKVLVTGASRGIGRAIADQMAEEGCDLVLVARSEDLLEEAREAIQSRHNVSVSFVATDLSVSKNQTALARDHGEIDILVNNAGAIPGGTIDVVDEATWRTAWDLKVFGYINICRAFYAEMKARRQGTIVNIIGTGGERPTADYICGATGNAGLIAFTRALGGASPADGIRVVAINPGPIATERLVGLLRTWAETRLGDAERWQEFTASMPFGRAGEPQEIARMAAFLASDQSSYTSGTVITVDGGKVNKGTVM